jgi:tellurite methyltransferase
VEYPVAIEGRQSADGGPLVLSPPPDIVREAGEMLRPESMVLDVGAHNGRNGFYLAEQGHKVLSVESNPDYIRDGKFIAQTLGRAALTHIFIYTDMRDIDVDGGFDAVVSTHALHMVEKPEAYDVLRALQNATKPGGFNILRTYIATAQQQAELPERAFFEPCELREIYSRSGWALNVYRETIGPWVRTEPVDGESQVLYSSAAELIAQKPPHIPPRVLLLAKADYFHNSDPEYSEVLRQQAETMTPA